MKLIYPDIDDLEIVDHDLVTADFCERAYSETHIFYGIDPDGNEWQWFEYRTYAYDTREWLPVDVRGLELIS